MTQKHVFDKDERKRINVQSDWSAETLLQQVGMAKLKDVVKILPIKRSDVQRAYNRLEKAGSNPYRVMGVRKLWNNWIVRLSVFAPYYRANLKPKFKKVDPGWDSEAFLGQTGTFLLSEVYHLTPFSAHQLRHQSLLLKDPRAVMGVYKDPDLNRYLVDIPVFRQWLKNLWENGGTFLPEQSPSKDDAP